MSSSTTNTSLTRLAALAGALLAALAMIVATAAPGASAFLYLGYSEPPNPGDPVYLRGPEVDFNTGSIIIVCRGALGGGVISSYAGQEMKLSLDTLAFGGGACTAAGVPVNLSIGPMSLPWTLGLNGRMGAAAFGGSRGLVLDTRSAAGGPPCTYLAKKLKGTFNTDGRPIQVTATPTKFKLVKSSSGKSCAPSGVLSIGPMSLTGVLPTGAEVPIVEPH